MINVFFVPGMFGTTIEYVARSYSNELTPVDGKILADGSMHSYYKFAHFFDVEQIDNFFQQNKKVEITTPIYPFENLKLPEILEYYKKYNATNQFDILIYSDSTRSAEINMLFKYHKIVSQKGLDIFCNGNEHNIINWDPTYKHWSEMTPWQLREWISLFYVHWVQEWIDSPKQVTKNFLCIKNTEFLFETKQVINQIFKHCQLTLKPGIDKFCQEWQQAQQYIVDEFNLLDRIVDCTINNQKLIWQPMNIIAEAIVQQRLRSLGYEIQCDGLDIFPTDAIMFNKLLEKAK